MNVPVHVTILGKEYQVACPEEQQDALMASARMVHQNMEKIRNSGKVVGVDRIAVMAALNIAHELLILQQDESHDLEKVNEKISQLKERVSAFINEDRQLEL
ncbi:MULTISPECIES: cell division protein ZapA [unclassified Methylophaga]|jgi:cell division protein ZapA|uniref:cell division protein ZapA n=1 Tax=unclassified Methylophaga TaxID=2629249 RepID=UPI000C93FA3F|nr:MULTISPECIES: cell division protein ZapA [unclassified Methylophaga]MAK66472.1 cell division protein ZapA [Methylophaga sp.]MAY17165.1 cell division protein ZapA [Methylophaga sp.]MBN46041.1 cell division protein ZapA [Methylophaga sp.]HAO25941.1 cell division protein ZapA [Methylophaga sp.]HCD04163.1 cell division protein ZapA [Methylophaga sp.]|tara:strand:+ start:79312 stop:79617 length:306 start_codon:yes stop_codon:yes gene_type:complete